MSIRMSLRRSSKIGRVAVLLVAGAVTAPGLVAAGAQAASVRVQPAISRQAAARADSPTTTEVTRQSIADLAYAQVGNDCHAYTTASGESACDNWWCAVFASWVWRNAGVSAAPSTWVATDTATWAQQNGLWVPRPAGQEGDPQPGDMVVYGQPGAGAGGHVGIVYSVNSDGTITTVDGDYNGSLPTTSHVYLDTVNPISAVSGGKGWPISGYITPPGVAAGHGPSLAGDGRADIVSIHSDGTVQAWRNVAGFAAMPWGGDSVTIATGMTDPTRVFFADLDGDGKTDIIYDQPDGTVTAWHNAAGFAATPWGGDSVTIATGMTNPTALRFADLDGDGKTDLVYDQPDGTVQAWHNTAGFAAMPWGGDSVTIATGMTNPAALRFADLDGDGKTDIIYDQPDGTVQAWHNIAGFAATPWGGDSVTIATGFTDPTTLQFA